MLPSFQRWTNILIFDMVYHTWPLDDGMVCAMLVKALDNLWPLLQNRKHHLTLLVPPKWMQGQWINLYCLFLYICACGGQLWFIARKIIWCKGWLASLPWESLPALCLCSGALCGAVVLPVPPPPPPLPPLAPSCPLPAHPLPLHCSRGPPQAQVPKCPPDPPKESKYSWMLILNKTPFDRHKCPLIVMEYHLWHEILPKYALAKNPHIPKSLYVAKYSDSKQGLNLANPFQIPPCHWITICGNKWIQQRINRNI